MRLFSLSSETNRPCYVLKFKDTNMMLDCGLDLNTLLHFMPVFNVQSKASNAIGTRLLQGNKTGTSGAVPCNIKDCNGTPLFDSEPMVSLPETDAVDLSGLDAIIISNYLSMLALPFITEETGFRGTIYATDPTVQTGRHLMEELIAYLGAANEHHPSLMLLDDNISGVPAELLSALSTNHRWRRIYTQANVNSCLSKVHTVAYNEKNSIYGLLSIMAISSGYCIGSCNWIIDSDHERVTYIAGSSTLTTHPRPMEHTSLKRADVMIITNLTRTPMQNPDSMIREFCMAAAATLKRGGNVLLPCLPCGITFDMFECLANHLKTCGFSHIPMYFISERAEASLAYSNIYAEWLTSSKTSSVYLPEPPFHHAELIKSGWLKAYPNICGEFNNSYRTPCVIFGGHPTLRCGDITHLMTLYCKEKQNTVIFTDADVNYIDALAPYQPVYMKVVHCPIDTRLSFAQANKLIRDLKPKHLVVPEEYTFPPTLQPGRTDLVIDPHQSNMVKHKGLDEMHLPLRRSYVTADMDPQLAAEMRPFEIKLGIAVVQMATQLKNHNNSYSMEPLGSDVPRIKRRKLQKPILYGHINISEFTKRLEEYGIMDAKVDDLGGGNTIIDLPNEGSLIRIEDDSIHIVCDAEAVRVKIRDATLQSLQRIEAARLSDR
ncbi:integrator complex subunit 9-like [Watersipora subatra]|uniref:integrator complex subunit 9-like n=1 Tax=Watersipora subatra TaxID=2589382 RepID=UPI00355C2EBB